MRYSFRTARRSMAVRFHVDGSAAQSPTAWVPAVLCLMMGTFLAAGPSPAVAGVSYDDRPPLIESRSVPEESEAGSALVDLVVSKQPGGAIDIVLTGDGGLPYDVFTLEGPNRLVVDLPGIDVHSVRPRIEVADDALVAVRVGQYREGADSMGRVVFDLTEMPEWSIVQDGRNLRVRIGSETTEAASLSDEQPAAPASEPLEVASASSPSTIPETAPEATEEIDPLERGIEEIEVDSILVEEAPAETVASEEIPLTATAPEEIPVQIPSIDRSVPEPVALVSGRPEAGSEEAEPAFARPKPTLTPASITEPASAEKTADSMAEPVAVEKTAEEINPASSAGDAVVEVNSFTSSKNEEDRQWIESEIADLVAQAAEKSSVTNSGLEGSISLNAGSSAPAVPLPTTELNTIQNNTRQFAGAPISLDLVDADIKQVFGIFHEISGLNFVLDPNVTGQVTIVVDQIPWDQAMDLVLKNNGLGMVLEGSVVRVAPVAKLAQEAAARKALNDAKELEDPPVTITRTLSYAKAKEVQRVVRQALLSTKGRVIEDVRTNTLIIRDVPIRIDAIDRLLTTLDAETPQVMIEARIVEVSRDFVHDLGVSWGFTGTASPALGTETNLDFPHRAAVAYDLNLPRNPAANALGFSFGNVLDSFTLDITLDALETEGYARRLSSPKIATQNNEPAEIEQGVRIPVVSTTATEIDVRFVSASLRLKVVPQITAEGTVVLEIEVENNSPDFVNTVGDVPAINTQRAQTKVLIADGGTTVIAGIFTVNEGRSEEGVPWLRNVPGLGWLFRSKNIQTRNRELLIFLTPRIIKAS